MVRIRFPPAASLQQTVPALGFEAPERSCGVGIRSQVQDRSAATLGRPELITMRGGAPIWNTPALDPQLGLIYFATGNCGPDYDGSMREGDNLFLLLDCRAEGKERRICPAFSRGAPRHLGLRRGEPGRVVRHRDQRTRQLTRRASCAMFCWHLPSLVAGKTSNPMR